MAPKDPAPMNAAAISLGLAALGFDPFAPNGLAGAVRAFQASRPPLKVDGDPGPKTQDALRAALAAGEARPAIPLPDLSPIGRAALIAREDCRLVAYRCTAGVLTIGVGHTSAAGGLKVTPGLRITQAEADALFAADIRKYVEATRRALRSGVAWPVEFFDACVSLCFNIGPVGFAESTVVRRANAGDLQGAADAFLMWNKPASIVARRQGERDQALTPYATALPRARRGDARPIQAPAARAA